MVGSLYPKGDTRIDAAYTIFYMGINLGAFFSPLVCGTLGDTGNPADFKWGFLAAGIGMLVGSLTFELLKNKYVVTAEGAPLGAKPERTVEHSPVVPVQYGWPGPRRNHRRRPPRASPASCPCSSACSWWCTPPLPG